MRSRAARFTCSAAVWLAIGGAAAFLVYSEKRIGAGRAAARTFDQRAREASDALAELRASQEAYVAAGQGVAYWVPKVSSSIDGISQALTTLGAVAANPASRTSIEEAAASVAEFAAIDKRVRDYIKSGQLLMAGDVIFTESGQTAAQAARYVESARLSEHQALDAAEMDGRKLEAAALGAAAVVALLAAALLGTANPIPADAPAATTGLGLSSPAAPSAPGELLLRDTSRREPTPTSVFSARAVSPILKNASHLCTELARVTSLEDLTALLGRAAEMLDASGLVVWLGNPAGADLRPVLAHGYNDQALARMPTVPRSADNAAAAAYRSGSLQIVLSRPGSSAGAVVAPLLGPDGCIGALSAEIVSGGEGSDAVQALATLFAAQLAAVLAAPSDAPAEPRAAQVARV
jgi:hypothetical protein